MMVMTLLKANWDKILITLLVGWALNALYAQGYKNGWDGSTLKTVELNAQLEADYDQKLIEIDKLKTDAEKAILTAVGKIDKAYLEGMENGKKIPYDIINELHDDNQRLSIELATRPTRTDSCDTDESATSTTIRDVPQRAELSREASAFLISEAKRADILVMQLSACQALVSTYYKALVEYEDALRQTKNKE